MASIVAFREYVRLEPADRAAVEVRRKALLDRFESIVDEGVADGDVRRSTTRVRRPAPS